MRMQYRLASIYCHQITFHSVSFFFFSVLVSQKVVCEDLSKISSNFTLHLIKVGKLKRFKKVSSDLKTILMTDLADLRLLAVS